MTDHNQTLLYKKITGFTDIAPESINKLFEITVAKDLKKGKLILRERRVCKTIVFVEKGYLRTYVEKDGVEINTDFTFENNFTTNLKSLRSNLGSDTNIITGEDSTIFEFDKDKLLDLYKVSPEIESFGRKLLEQLLISQEEHSNLFKIYSPTERYHYLLQHNPNFLQRVSLSQLASYLGVTRETLTRIRRKK